MTYSHLGHFVLTTTLLPLLKHTASLPSSDVRVVTLSSIQHSSASNDVSFIDRSAWNKHGDETGANLKWAMSARYSKAKLANLLFAKELQRRVDRDGVPIISVAVHPGAAGTGEHGTIFLIL